VCGITGIAAFDNNLLPSQEQLKKMVDTLYHRGPDEEGMYIAGRVALGMRRLSIIDLEGGHQPVTNENGTIRTIFNGEIYNYRELRKQLRSYGHVFTTHSDTETIVHAYEQYGADFPLYLNGMFAIALYDSVKQKLFLVRDPIGVKPLYYSFQKNFIVWGSEIKAILASELVNKELDVDALGEFLAWEYVPGKSTLLQAVCKLEPGTILEIDLQNPVCHPRTYWDISCESPAAKLNDADWEELIYQQLKTSTQRQMVSDVPLGAFLSGGVDSSLMVAAMENAKTFSIGFENGSYNELKWSGKVADYLKLQHTQETLQPEVGELFYELMHFWDDPIGDFSIFPTYLVSRLARKEVKVALSGDGGDELFGGYETYLANNLAHTYHRIPPVIRKEFIERFFNSLKPRPAKKGFVNKAKRFLAGMDQPPNLGHARWRVFAGETIRSELFTPEAQKSLQKPVSFHIAELFRRSASFSPLNQSLYVDVKSYLCDNILAKVDRMSMAVSLEARVPYLDTDLVNLAFQVPDHLKVHKRQTKVLLKRIAAKHVPRECVYRPKEGFSIPVKNWLNSQFRPIMEEFLNEHDVKTRGIFNIHTVDRLKKEHLAGMENHSHILWSLIVFHAWQKRWLNY